MRHRHTLPAILLLAVGALALSLSPITADDAPAPDPGLAVGILHYESLDADDAACFSPRFLTRVARTTDLPVQTELDSVTLSDDTIFNYPFLIITGSDALQLTEDERDHLQAYIQQGGFLLASARCGSEQWADDFARLVADITDHDDALQPVDLDHPLLHTLYEIDRIAVPDPSDWTDRSPLQAYTLDGRVRILFSPAGLNDSQANGPDCRCCTGMEIRNAPLINANALVYALTR